MSVESGEFGGGSGSYGDGFDSSSLEEEYEKVMSYLDDVDYYSLLALPRDPPPTDAQIRSAYRTLTLSFHPDKQPAHLHEAATKHFDRIRQAYDTLIDPKKRIVYDMLGEEGVKAEWGGGGTVGKAEGAGRNQVGVKSMDEEQFRRWFLRTMKLRELKTVEQMVQSRTTLSVKVDAHGLAMRMIDPAAVKNAPLSQISSLVLGYSFKTPFAPLRLVRLLSGNKDEEETEDKDEGVVIPNEQDVQLEIHAAVGGKLREMKQLITLMDPVTQEQTTKEVTMPRGLVGGNISLGATLRHQIHFPAQKKSTLNKLLSPLLDDSLVEAGGTLLPSPGLQATISKRIQPIPGTRQVNVAVQAVVSDLTFRTAPTLSTSIQRGLGARGLTYCNWSSGALSWPSFIQGLFAPLPSNDNELSLAQDNGKFEIGYVALPVRRVQNQFSSSGEEGEAEEADELSRPTVDGGEPLETWGFLLHSSPFSMQLSLNYARNVFGGGKAEEPPRSEWNYEGYQPQKETRISRAVRLEVTATVGVDLSLGWMVSGSRQVSDFTRMGLGVGVQGRKGLVCIVTWRRLGQSIKVPIAVCPLEYLESDVGVLAVIIPWITYSIVEFGFLRPRERRKQKQALSKERKRLRSLIAKRKAESIQAIKLMRDQVQRRQAREADRNGLVILEAQYGYVPPKTRRRRDGDADEFARLVDVTIPVAALVDQGQLTIPSQVIKSQILGFYDPAPFLQKVLRIRYRFAGAEHAIEVNDSEGVTIPMRSHMV